MGRGRGACSILGICEMFEFCVGENILIRRLFETISVCGRSTTRLPRPK